jgi:hypothetical protein
MRRQNHQGQAMDQYIEKTAHDKSQAYEERQLQT